MTHHHVSQGLLIGVFCHHITDVLTLTQNGHAVGHVQHLMELVRNDNQGFAVGLHVAHNGKQLVGLLRRQYGGRLIQNQNIRAAVEHLHDFDGLLLGNRHIVDLHVGVDFEAVLLADVFDLLAGVIQIQLTLQTKDDVFRSGEQIDQLEVLMDHADSKVKSVLGGGYGHGLAVNIDPSLIGIVDAGEHIHQCGLAAAVLAQQ